MHADRQTCIQTDVYAHIGRLLDKDIDRYMDIDTDSGIDVWASWSYASAVC